MVTRRGGWTDWLIVDDVLLHWHPRRRRGDPDYRRFHLHRHARRVQEGAEKGEQEGSEGRHGAVTKMSFSIGRSGVSVVLLACCCDC